MARAILIAVTAVYLGLFLIAPFAAMLVAAFGKGLAFFAAAVAADETIESGLLTLLVVAIVVPLNTLFGLAAAWSIGKFEFRGKQTLIALIDVPYAVSPVVAGLVFVLVLGHNSVLGSWLEAHGLRVIFATPGLILATLFVTFPIVARELVPLFESQERDEEEAALLLGASGWQTFLRVTLPNAKWGVLYGVVMCAARAAGEFGAVSVVSGHIRGETTTLPLHVEILYNEYNMAGASAVASLVAAIGLLTLVIKGFFKRSPD